MEIAHKLKLLRQRESLSQAALAHKLHVSTQAVSKWECGKSYPDLFNLITLSELYDVSLDELVKTDLKLQKKLTGKSNHRKLLSLLFSAFIITFIFIIVTAALTSYITKQQLVIHWGFFGICYLLITSYLFVILKGYQLIVTKK